MHWLQCPPLTSARHPSSMMMYYDVTTSNRVNLVDSHYTVFGIVLVLLGVASEISVVQSLYKSFKASPLKFLVLGLFSHL